MRLGQWLQRVSGLFIVGALLASSNARADEAEAWHALRDGEAVLILRHALAPGIGDPDHFDVNDCSTQRNLNDVGRQQARDWGRFLAQQGIDQARVFSSAWCRCRETAELMDLGSVSTMASLNSFFGGQGNRSEQTAATVDNVNALPSGLPVVMVSHQVNISALTGSYTSSGEGLILSLPLGEGSEVLAQVMPPSVQN
ncbi:histidine phosphatase family protein [Marinobacter sp. JSM 1782161]|uniref:histidine phosphatase family protein n=1 Tax=Marinobacter sp. JSM 1782161 TaxID=2685906 RepID=UPI001403C623|nr:histidine phosphatase family protein [Marinobacter sp. JSM 1782161]